MVRSANCDAIASSVNLSNKKKKCRKRFIKGLFVCLFPAPVLVHLFHSFISGRGSISVIRQNTIIIKKIARYPYLNQRN